MRVSESGVGAYEPALAAVGGGVAVAWYDNRDGNAEVYRRLVGVEPDPGASALGRDGLSPEYRLTRSGAESYEASIDRLGDGLAVAWYEKSATGDLEARLGLWTVERGSLRETPVWETPVEAHGGPSRNPVVVADGERGRVFCAWIERPLVAYSAAGSGSFGLAWSDEVDGGRQIFFLALDAGGSPLGEPRRLSSGDGLKFVPVIEALGDGFALTWNEVRPGPGGLHGGDSRSEVSSPQWVTMDAKVA